MRSQRKQTGAVPTFCRSIEEALPSLADGLIHKKHCTQCWSTLDDYAVPHICRTPINEIIAVIT